MPSCLTEYQITVKFHLPSYLWVYKSCENNLSWQRNARQVSPPALALVSLSAKDLDGLSEIL